MMKELLTSPDTVIAVVGATDSPGKYGGIIYRDLKRKGFQVRAVNPNRATVAGDPAYPNLASVPDEIDIVDMVVSPQDGDSVLAEAIELGLPRIWFQPGSESRTLTTRSEEAGLETISHACIMVVARNVA